MSYWLIYAAIFKCSFSLSEDYIIKFNDIDNVVSIHNMTTKKTAMEHTVRGWCQKLVGLIKSKIVFKTIVHMHNPFVHLKKCAIQHNLQCPLTHKESIFNMYSQWKLYTNRVILLSEN